MNLFKHRAAHLIAILALAAAAACERTAVQDAHAQTSTGALSSAGVPDTAAAYALSAAFRTAADRTLPAVVYVRVEQAAQVQPRGRAPQAPPIPEEFRRFFEFGDPEQGELPPQGGSGSGFIIDADGHAVTNNHVIADAQRITVRLVDGREFDATLVGTDPNTDIALIKIEANGAKLPVIPGFGDAERMRVGDWVLALGNPLGYDFTVTAGIVSAKGRQLALGNREALESYIQTDAAINVGNSGGPLVDLSGRVVGVNTAIGGASRWVGYGFAVPSDLVQRVLADIREFGHVRRPKLGVSVQPVTALDAEVFGLDRVAGAKVFNVEKGTPADHAGVRAGDVIMTLDGKDIATSNALTTSLAQHHPGERVTLGIVRDKRRTEVAVTLGEFEQDAHDATPRNVAGRGAREERLGFTVQSLTPQMAAQFELAETSGVVVVDVRNFSPAAGAAVRPGLLIRTINGQAVSTPQDVGRIAEDIEPGDAVSIRGVYTQFGEVVINFRAR